MSRRVPGSLREIDPAASEFLTSTGCPAGLRRALLSGGVAVRFKVQGCSMIPFIRGGDFVTIAPASRVRLRRGDIAAFARAETGPIVIHRVVQVHQDGLLTRGDNCPEPDGLIPFSRILGYVTRVERDGRKLRLGLGPERRLIALLNRAGLLTRMLLPVRKLSRLFVPRTRTE